MTITKDDISRAAVQRRAEQIAAESIARIRATEAAPAAPSPFAALGRLAGLAEHLSGRHQAEQAAARAAEQQTRQQIPPLAHEPWRTWARGVEEQPPAPTAVPSAHEALAARMLELVPPDLAAAAAAAKARAEQTLEAVRAAEAERAALGVIEPTGEVVDVDELAQRLARRAALEVAIPVLERNHQAAGRAYTVAIEAAREALRLAARPLVAEVRADIRGRLAAIELLEEQIREAELALSYSDSAIGRWLP